MEYPTTQKKTAFLTRDNISDDLGERLIVFHRHIKVMKDSLDRPDSITDKKPKLFMAVKSNLDKSKTLT
jgi:hypothetical protein